MAGKKEKPWKRAKVRGAESLRFFSSTPNLWLSHVYSPSIPYSKQNQQHLHDRY